MVDLSRDANGRNRTRLLDMAPGRSGATYRGWRRQRGAVFRDRVRSPPWTPFHEYKNAVDDQLDDARAVLDAFHVVKLATQVVDEVRRRVLQDIHGHHGRKDDPLYRIRNILRAGAEKPDRPPTRRARAGVHCR
jgi:transposase